MRTQYVLYNYMLLIIENEKLNSVYVIHHIKSSWKNYEKIAKPSVDETIVVLCV